ncbi:methanogen output domain 1-containing protein [Methanothermobacter sp. K4]|uniref:methanogen output domain 1-containing protein n=1 Tax=Methanothermobacter sp. K4 TaxID=2913262 RepID=UPI001EDA2780|nr:methanogen output domain 1-containing protein [Methanothermobacter sp. K4]MCG2828451.1 methanogen output domain 1-containing protein [Methanothermobacter sp. K4]
MARILVVEDEAIVAMGIRHKLETMGHEVVDTVSTGRDAIRASKIHEPDLVLMDIVLKGEMDGIEAAREIRDRFNIPIIYLTAYADEEMLARAKITEPYGYIVKPFKSSELNANIEMAIYRHRSAMREMELMRKRIISDFYNFILNAMPSPDAERDEIRELLSGIFRDRIISELKPGFEAYMEESTYEDPLEAYLAWVADVFENFTVRVGFLEDDENVYVEFENCPWIDDARKNPGFCLNCEAILKLSFDWSGLPGDFRALDHIADGSERCLFRFSVK